jgi:hypothetical protein
MAVKLWNVMHGVWERAGHTTELQATGGSATTIVSTYSPFTSDDALLNGTAIVTYDAGGAGASPEGRFATITDYVASTKTFTIDTVTDAIATGDKISLAKSTIRKDQMIRFVNSGLANLGTISLVDTSLITVEGQTEYALPVGLKIKRLHDVLLQGSTESGDGQYYSIKGMVQDFPAAPASTGLLQFSSPMTAGYIIKLVYEGVHPKLNVYSDTVSETVQERLAIASTIEAALQWLVSKRGESAAGTMLVQHLNAAKQELAGEKYEKPVTKASTKPKYFISGL